MKRIYDYHTGALLESEGYGPFYVSFSEVALADGVEVMDDCFRYPNNGRCTEFASIDEAKAEIEYVVNEMCDEVGVDFSECEVDDRSNMVIYTIPGFKEITFVISNECDECSESKKEKKSDVLESVSERFGRYRKLYESDDEDDKQDDEQAEDEGDDKSEDDNKEEESGEDEEQEITAVIITVAAKDADACKEELIDAGVAEEDIEVLDSDADAEDEDAEVEIKIGVDSIMELKTYLEGKGIDLEEKIGGEIVDDSEEDGDESDGEGDEKSEDGDDKDDDKEDDVNFDEFDDIFGGAE